MVQLELKTYFNISKKSLLMAQHWHFAEHARQTNRLFMLAIAQKLFIFDVAS